MNTPLRGFSLRARRRALSLLVLVSLLAPVVSPLADVNLWGWQPDHGHASLVGAIPAHVHPSDAESHDAPPSDSVVFTAGDLLGAPALPVTPISELVLPQLSRTLVGVPSAAPAIALDGAPEPPPPR